MKNLFLLLAFFASSSLAHGKWVKSKDKNGETKSTRKRLVRKQKTIYSPPVPIGVIYAPGFSYDYNRRNPRYFNGINGPGDYTIRDNRPYRYPNPRFQNNEHPEINGEALGIEPQVPKEPAPLIQAYDPNVAPRSQFFFNLGFDYAYSDSRSRTFIDIQMGHRFLEFGEIRGGVAFLHDRRSYSGLSLGARGYMPWKITPYVGGGFYLGRFQKCETVPFDDDFNQEICERYDTTRLYPELGVLYRSSQKFRWLAFVRQHFTLSDSNQNTQFEPYFGISFQYR